MKKKENIIMTVGLLLLIVAVLGVSYAAFSYTRAGEKINTITTGVISMTYTESDNIITMDKALPTTDDTGKVRLRDGEYFDFTVSSTIQGNAIINYEVAAEALSSNTFAGNNVKLYLTKINGTTEEEIMLPKLYIPRTTANTKTGRPSGMVSLTTGSMGTSETIKYRLRMYVKEGYNPQDDNGNEVFQVKVNVYGKVEQQKATTGTLIKGTTFDSEGNIIDFPIFRDSDNSWYSNSIVTKDNNEIPSTAIESWDISEAGDGKAVAYIEENGLVEDYEGISHPAYKLTLGGEGGLLANLSMREYFGYFEDVEKIDLTYLDTSLVTDMSYMFSENYNLTTLDINNFDTSNVTNMSGMFSGCSSLTTLNLSSFDTSSVTNMSYMFSGCSSLVTLNISSFNTSNVTDMIDMFYRCSSLTALDLSSFDTSKVANMSGMFIGCTILTSFDLSSFDTSNVIDMGGMFAGCTSLTTLNLSNFDTSKVTSMGSMFASCSGLTSLDLSSFDTSNVLYMSRMFQGCTSLTTLNISSFDKSNVKTYCDMFHQCSPSIIPPGYSNYSCDR